jgi:LSD1 subclass zinc finger protein
MRLNWRDLNKKLSMLSEEQVLQLLNDERIGARRVTVLERLHQRYTMLRAARERVELLKEASSTSTQPRPMCRTLGANLDGDHSVKCPICGTWTEVKLTRQKDGFVLRSRVCGNEHRFSTEERHVPSNQHGGARFRNVEPGESGEIRSGILRQDTRARRYARSS